MSVDVFTLGCTQLPTAKLVGFKGTEPLSRPFEFDLFFTVPAGTDVRAAVGANATLTADRKDGRDPQCWHGVFARLRLLHQTAERALYHGLLVPKLWLLRHSIRSHVSTKENIKQFLSHALEHGGLVGGDFDFRIAPDKYPVEELVCQYRESHLDFLHRWLEREGLYYFFEHEPASNGSELCVIVDDKGKHRPLLGEGKGKVPYFPVAGDDVTAGEGFRDLHCDFERLPASVLITDYNYANPAAPVEGTGTVSSTGFGEIRDYGYRVFDENEAGRLAGIKAASISCRELTLHAAGNAMYLRAGYTFEVEDGPEELPRSYLAIEVRHAGSVAGAVEDVRRYTGLHAEETYRVELYAIPSDVQFRAAQVTPWPRIYGFENAVIDGEAESPYAQIDEQGRYLVRFKFDASTLGDGKASTYVRMMQPHGGTTEGHHFPLRKSTEVMIAFQGGDPDRPLIAGVVPNAHKPSTITSKNHTKNIIRTGSGNYIEMEDLKGKEYVHFLTPKLTFLFMGDPTPLTWSGYKGPAVAATCEAATFPSVDVKATFDMFTDGDASTRVMGNWWEQTNLTKNVHVVGDVTVAYDSKYTLDVGAHTADHHYATKTTTIDQRYEQTVASGGMKHDIHGGLEQTVEPKGSQTVTGPWTHKVTELCTDDYQSWDSKATDGWTLHDTAKVTWTIGAGGVTINAPKVTINGAEVETKGSTWWKGFTPLSVELYGGKEEAGVQKFDAAAICTEAFGYKKEYQGNKESKSGNETKLVAMHSSTAMMMRETITIQTKNAVVKIDRGACRMESHGFTKIGS